MHCPPSAGGGGGLGLARPQFLEWGVARKDGGAFFQGGVAIFR